MHLDWQAIGLYVVTALLGIILGGIRWYLLDIHKQLKALNKKIDDGDSLTAEEIRHIHSRIDQHLQKGH